MRMAGCHPDRKYFAREMCQSCYSIWDHRDNPNKPRAICHPDKPHASRGLCQTCYRRWLYHNKPEHRAHVNIKNRKYYDNNRDRVKIWATNRWLVTKYGINSEDYEVLLNKQSGVCKICGGIDSRNLAVDHDHITGEIRGLLCTNCNSGIGKLKDSVNLLTRAIKYLQGDL